jgi:hypothetical protein
MFKKKAPRPDGYSEHFSRGIGIVWQRGDLGYLDDSERGDDPIRPGSSLLSNSFHSPPRLRTHVGRCGTSIDHGDQACQHKLKLLNASEAHTWDIHESTIAHYFLATTDLEDNSCRYFYTLYFFI